MTEPEPVFGPEFEKVLADRDPRQIAGRAALENAREALALERMMREFAALAPEDGGDEKPAAAYDSQVVTLEEFSAVEEPGAAALVGEDEEPLIPEGGDVMIYGDGGAGKTTLAGDLACHLAAGDDWLGIAVSRPVRVLIVENEGPRALFRTKMRRKLAAWAGSPLEGRVLIWQEPWARVTFADEAWRQVLAEQIREHEVDVVVIGPVTAAGMEQAGTLQDVRLFAGLVNEVRSSAGRLVTFVLIHHENKGGQVSGAWEGVGDTLFHVQGQGHGRTRLYIQKARWSSEWHATALNLTWVDGEGFAVKEKPELDDEQLAALIVAAVHENPGTSWRKVVEATRGVNDARRQSVRDGLLAGGVLVNVVKKDGVEVALDRVPERTPSRLYVADDPAITHLLPASAAVRQQSAAGGAGRSAVLLPAADPIEAAGSSSRYAPRRAGLAMSRSPSLTIQLPFEGSPRLWVDCSNDSEEARLWDWIRSREEVADLVGRAVELAEEARAA